MVQYWNTLIEIGKLASYLANQLISKCEQTNSFIALSLRKTLKQWTEIILVKIGSISIANCDLSRNLQSMPATIESRFQQKKTDMKTLNKRFCYQSAQFYVIDFPLCRSLSLFSSPSLAKRLMRCNWCAYMSFFLYLKATAPRVSAFNDFIVHMDALEIVDWIISIQKCARSLSWN